MSTRRAARLGLVVLGALLMVGMLWTIRVTPSAGAALAPTVIGHAALASPQSVNSNSTGRPPPSAPDTRPTPALDAVMERASRAFSNALEAESGFREYAACLRVESRSACEQRFVDILAAAVWALAGTFDDDAYGFGAVLSSNPEVVEQLGLVASTHPDAATRLAALMLLNRTPHIVQQRLPVEAYEALSERSSIEVTLVLDRHSGDLALDHPAAVAVSRLILDEPETSSADGKAQAVIVALGHPETQDLLATTLDVVTPDGVPQPLVRQVGTAVGRCGAPCLDYITRLVTSTRASDRYAAYGAMGYLRPEERGPVAYEIEHATRPRLDPDEQIDIDRVLRLRRSP